MCLNPVSQWFLENLFKKAVCRCSSCVHGAILKPQPQRMVICFYFLQQLFFLLGQHSLWVLLLLVVPFFFSYCVFRCALWVAILILSFGMNDGLHFCNNVRLSVSSPCVNIQKDLRMRQTRPTHKQSAIKMLWSRKKIGPVKSWQKSKAKDRESNGEKEGDGKIHTNLP